MKTILNSLPADWVINPAEPQKLTNGIKSPFTVISLGIPTEHFFTLGKIELAHKLINGHYTHFMWTNEVIKLIKALSHKKLEILK